ncbi:MAG: hypothetical protein KGL39_26840, partial [Patescibacteria group bacterium]|nr:hypothetical protein [Patescibacteria group bacterium]
MAYLAEDKVRVVFACAIHAVDHRCGHRTSGELKIVLPLPWAQNPSFFAPEYSIKSRYSSVSYTDDYCPAGWALAT